MLGGFHSRLSIPMINLNKFISRAHVMGCASFALLIFIPITLFMHRVYSLLHGLCNNLRVWLEHTSSLWSILIPPCGCQDLLAVAQDIVLLSWTRGDAA